ncbi:MAG: MBL fold metallo-hydrolase [Lachnospiraceae bacterium]
MRICENVYQIKIEFHVTPEIKRYVYVYLITGKYCYLVDAGVAGCEEIIGDYMEKLGRSLSEIKAVFLTHAHPDHIGGVAELKRKSGCEIYASAGEKRWIEDIGVQFEERPIPNFYSLVKESVKVERVVKENDKVVLEPGLTMRVSETAGHSRGAVSYVYEENKVIFCGDAIPAPNDFPIFEDEAESEAAIEKIQTMNNIRFCCPAWDRVYIGDEIGEITQESLEILRKLKKCVCRLKHNGEALSAEEIRQIGSCMGLENMAGNPLFRRSIEACRKTNA